MTTNPLRDQIIHQIMRDVPREWRECSSYGWAYPCSEQASVMADRVIALLDAQAPHAEPVAWAWDQKGMFINEYYSMVTRRKPEASDRATNIQPLYVHPATRDIASGQQVRALQWDENNYAKDEWGGYSITERLVGDGDEFGWYHSSRGDFDESDDTWLTVELAKAAAQADYERRILAALTPAPDAAQTDNMALVEAQKLLDDAHHLIAIAGNGALPTVGECKGWLKRSDAQYQATREAAALSRAPQHADDAAVDRFAAAMKAKMAKGRDKGRAAWDDPTQCTVEYLAQLLLGHIPKGNAGNFEDIANLAMMLHQRGADPAILRAPQPAPDAVAETELDNAWLRESELRQALKAAMDDEPGWYDLARDARNTSLAARTERIKARALASQDKEAQG